MKSRVMLAVVGVLAIYLLSSCGRISQEEEELPETDLAKAEAKVAVLQSNLKIEKSMGEELKAQMGTYQNQVAGLQSDSETEQAKVEELQAQLETYQNQVAEFQSDSEIEQAEVEELQAQLRTHQNQVIELQSDLETERTKVDDIQSQVETYQAEIAELKEQLATYLAQIITGQYKPTHTIQLIELENNPEYWNTDWDDGEVLWAALVVNGVYFQTHTYIPSTTDFDEMVMGIWNMLSAEGITSIIVRGNHSIIAESFADSDRAWLLIYTSQGASYVLEPTTARIYTWEQAQSESDLLQYWEGYMYVNPSDLRADLQ